MYIDYETLNKFLKLNNHIKLKFRENSNTLDIIISNEITLSLELISNNLEHHSELIYNSIINLEGYTMYIPKIHIKK